jgi:hypothetical protein
MNDLVVRLHRALVDAMRQRAARLDQPVTVAEIYQDLIPYRMVRSLGFALNADYEFALLQLLSGDGQLARIEPQEVREELRLELLSPNPNVGMFRQYAACDVFVNAPADEPQEDASHAPDVRRHEGAAVRSALPSDWLLREDSRRREAELAGATATAAVPAAPPAAPEASAATPQSEQTRTEMSEPGPPEPVEEVAAPVVAAQPEPEQTALMSDVVACIACGKPCRSGGLSDSVRSAAWISDQNAQPAGRKWSRAGASALPVALRPKGLPDEPRFSACTLQRAAHSFRPLGTGRPREKCATRVFARVITECEEELHAQEGVGSNRRGVRAGGVHRLWRRR